MVGARQRVSAASAASSIGPLPAGRTRDEMVLEVAGNLDGLPPDATLVVACSGGPDSSALAHLVTDARPDLALVLVHVAHGLRDRTDDRSDRGVVATHASWLGARLVGCDVEVTRDGRGIEAAARDARYRALRTAARSCGAAAIAVGHSADDQAETVLLRIARGTGTEGLAAMAVTAGDLVRPLLRLRRSDLQAFVAGEGLPVALDATNDDDGIRRVRVRREVLPALARIAPDPVAALGRLADLARDDAAALAAAAQAVPDAVRRIGPVVALRTEALRAVPIAIARNLIRHAMTDLVDTPPSAATVTRILAGHVGDAATLPGGIAFRAERHWRTLVVADAGARAGTGADAASTASVPLEVPGQATWHAAGLTIRALIPDDDDSDDQPDDQPADQPTDRPAPQTRVAGSPPVVDQMALSLPGAWSPPRHRVDLRRTAPGTVGVRYALVLPASATGLCVRASQPGDRIRGPGGTRRIAEVLRDTGMPRAIRAGWPLVCRTGDEEGIVWVPGVAVDVDLAAAGRRDPGIALQATPS
jgi:tRNA(Ile)-lysidine synthase